MCLESELDIKLESKNISPTLPITIETEKYLDIKWWVPRK